MHTDDVRAFVAVVEAGSVSRAARELHLTQPAVTRRVQRLEQAVGAPLIDRRKRPFALTDVGRAAVERCRRLLSTTHELKALTQGGIVPSREVRIGVAHALTELALTEPVDEMRRECPEVVLRLHTGWSRDLLARVRSGALDAAVILLPEGEAVPGGVDGRILAREHLAVVAPRSWRSRFRAIRDLKDMGWILNPEGCAARAGLQRELARARMPLRVSVETYNYELQLSLIARGRGLGLVPGRLLARSPSRARLCSVRVRGLEFPLTVWMVTGELEPSLERPVETLSRMLGDRLSASVPRRR
jgi:DNA-binding transcriptional LysR family regulator